MDYLTVVGIEVVNAVATLVLVSIGLAIVFGMMKVINLAHGEFIMIGGYAAITATQLGVNIWVAILVVSPLAVALLGLVVERLVIRFLYGRMVDTMLATWGLSLLLIGGITAIYGNTTIGLSPPLGSFTIGGYALSLYTVFLTATAAVVLTALYAPAATQSAPLMATQTAPPRAR